MIERLLLYLGIFALGVTGVVLLALSADMHGPWQLGLVAMVLFMVQGVLMGSSWRRR